MKAAAIILAALCAGCGPDGDSPYAAPVLYVCTAEQHDKAIKETEQAKAATHADNTSWLYGAALIRNCTKKEK